MSELTEVIRRQTLLEQRLDNLVSPEVGRWLDWTPAVDQNGVVAATVTEAQYKRNEDDARLYCQLSITGAGTAGNAIFVTGWPATINPNPGPVGWPCGVGTITDSGVEVYEGVVGIFASNQLALFSPTTNNWVGVDPSFALANGDRIYFNLYWKI